MVKNNKDHEEIKKFNFEWGFKKKIELIIE